MKDAAIVFPGSGTSLGGPHTPGGAGRLRFVGFSK